MDFQDIKNNQLIGLLVDSRYRLLRHLILLLGFLLVLYNVRYIFKPLGDPEYLGVYEYYNFFTTYILFFAMFYLNLYVLVPLFFFKGRYVLYVTLAIAVVILGLVSIRYISIIYFEPYTTVKLQTKANEVRVIFAGSMLGFPFIFQGTTVKLIQRWIKDNERINELKNLTISMELNELKNQINPHFLFNMLNNVNVLIKSNPEKAYLVNIKLSEFLRYQLYENNEEKTLLTSEINFLTSFLNLEKIRRDYFTFALETKADERNLNTIFLPPNLFTTFVENAVKHSIDFTDNNTYIKISIEIHNKKLHFSCVNSKSNDELIPNAKNSGLGFVNIKRRLELLYQNQYQLDVRTTENEYTVNLTIPI